MHNLLQARHSYWRPVLPNSAVNNPVLKEWLTEKKSLTKKAIDCIGPVEVDVVTSQWHIPHPCEAIVLNIPPRHLAFIREIFICYNGSRYWYGRTIVPKPLVLGKMRLITRLGNRSLANLLFPHAPLKRGKFEFAQLNERHFEYHKALQYISDRPSAIFGRRSRFYDEHHSFLLIEILLPELVK